MLSAASAGEEIAKDDAVRRSLMMGSLERVRAMRAQAVAVFQEHLVVGHPEARLVRGKLQPDAAALGGTPVDHQRVALGVVIREQQRRVCRGQPDAVANRAVIKLIAPATAAVSLLTALLATASGGPRQRSLCCSRITTPSATH